ncbi:MAG: hypothetical protein WKF37_20520 [Bryobacteraceae bacterium]
MPAGGSATSQLTFDCASGRCLPLAIRPNASGQLTLELYGTGIRGRSNLSGVQAMINGVPLQVLFAGPQSEYPGLDQVNVQVPASLFNAGVAQIVLTVDGVAANPVAIQLGGSGVLVPVSVLFDPARPEIGPFPTDALTVADTSQKTGLRVNLPLPDCAVQTTTCETYRLLNELDGFNLHPRVSVRFSGPVSPGSAQSGVVILWLNNLTAEERGLQPAGHVTALERAIIDPATNTLYAKPVDAMDQHRRYLLVITDAVREASGLPVTADPAFRACITAPATAYCRQLAAEVQAAAPRVRGTIVGAALFTTLSATNWVESARAAVQNAPVNLKRTGNVNLSSLAAATLRQQTGTNPVAFTDFTVPIPGVTASGVDRVFFGSYSSLNYVDSRQIITRQPAVSTVEIGLMPLSRASASLLQATR